MRRGYGNGRISFLSGVSTLKSSEHFFGASCSDDALNPRLMTVSARGRKHRSFMRRGNVHVPSTKKIQESRLKACKLN